MNIVTVYPIIRGAFKEELTYWSSHSFQPGTIIEVPLRGKNIPALVGTAVPASHAKANIKQASFVTRKIEKQKELQAVREECVRACEKVSKYFSVSFGSVLKACIPDAVLQDQLKNHELIAEKIQPRELHGIASDMLVFQTNTADRLSTYKSIVREEFARKRSMLIVAPTVISAEELHANLQKGIEDYVVMIHGGLSKKKQLERWKGALKNEHPVLIIVTPLFASIPKADIQTIVLERESSRAYGAFRAPYIDYRDYIEQYARSLGARLIFGDTLLRVETLYRREKGELIDFFPISYRVEKAAELVIVDTSTKKIEKAGGIGGIGGSSSSAYGTGSSARLAAERAAMTGRMTQNERLAQAEAIEAAGKDAAGMSEKKPYSVMSEELHSMIDYAGKKSAPMFVFAARRGLSPQTVCGDCGHTVECEICKAPIVLHQKKRTAASSVNSNAASHAGTSGGQNLVGGERGAAGNEHGLTQSELGNHQHNSLGADANRFFLCHHCGAERSALETCVACGSWRLVTLGVGLETVAEEIKKQFPKREIYRLDKDTITTDKQALAMVADFQKSKDGILLGTESSLAFLPEVTYSAIASLDSLFSIPDFKINERIAHTMLRILEKTSGYVLIQTRNPKNSVLKHIESGSLLSMYREEISMRKMLQYPPFITHIKVTVEDTRSGAADKMQKLQRILEEWNDQQDPSSRLQALVFPAFVPGAKGKSTLHMLLSLPKHAWPNEHLRSILATLPKEYIVRVNPESLL